MNKIYQENGMYLDDVRRRAFNEFNELVYTKKIIISEQKQCFCGSETFQILSRYDRFGLPFGTKICLDCGLISQTIGIDESSLPKFYQDIYWPLIAGSNKYSTASDTNFANKLIIKHLPANKKLIRIFEIGCGSGHRISSLSNKIRSLGIDVDAYGCDYSGDAVKEASNNGVNVVKGGFNELEKFGTADILIMSHVLEHMPNLNYAMRSMDKITDISSIIYIEVPGVIDLENKKEYGYDYQDYSVLAHCYNFSLQTLSNVMSAGGFSMLEGDEYVRAIFQRGAGKSSNGYFSIMKSLARSHTKSQFYKRGKNGLLYKIAKKIQALIKKILSI